MGYDTHNITGCFSNCLLERHLCQLSLVCYGTAIRLTVVIPAGGANGQNQKLYINENIHAQVRASTRDCVTMHLTIFLIPMLTYLAKLKVLNIIKVFIYIHTLCMQVSGESTHMR